MTYFDFQMYMRMYQTERDQPLLLVNKLHPDAIVPTRGTPFAAGLDLYAVGSGQVEPAGTDSYFGNREIVSTGIAIALPPGYEGQVRPRSGLAAKHGISVTNSPGTIDEDYRGEVKVLLINHGRDTFYWTKGDRIGQLVITKANYFDVVEVEELDATDRGAKGFGSTGR